MKKIISLFIIIIFISSVSINTYAKELVLKYDGSLHKYSGIIYKLMVNGKTSTSDMPPVDINKRQFVSVRAVFESLGATLRWEPGTQKFYIVHGTTKLEFKANSSSVKVNNKIVKMDTAAKLINDRLMIPVTFFSQNLKLTVGVFPDKSLIKLDKKPTPVAVSNKITTSTGILNSIKYTLKPNQCEVLINLNNYKDIKSFTLANPDRLVVDINNVVLKENLQNIKVDSDFVKAIRCSQLDPQTARVVLDLAGQTKYEVLKSDGQLVISVTGNRPTIASRGGTDDRITDLESLLDIKYIQNSDNDEVAILTKNYYGYNVVMDENVNRIIIRIPGISVPNEKKTFSYNGGLVQSVVYSQFDTNTVIIGIYLNVKSQYQVFEEDGKLTVHIVQVIESSDLESSNPPSNEVNNTTPSSESGFDIKHNTNNNIDEISLLVADYSNYKVSTMDNPNRIVIDIPYTNGSSSEKIININSNFINAARYAQYSDNILRVVLDVTGEPEFEVIEEKGQLVVRVISCKYKNIKYQNIGDRFCLIINNSKLTEGGLTLKKLYNESFDESGNKYIISFPNSYANLDKGIIKVNDNLLDSIEIMKDANLTSIVFNAKDKFYYNVFSRSELKDTTITILKPVTKEAKLVVIDPGHGGHEPGAVNSNVKEKDLNLDIAQRLYVLLKSNNINTYILRYDDSYLGLYERTTIANNLNATLFLSIHNNAFNSSEKGTETLYNYAGTDNGSFNNKKFAQIIQSSLVKALGSVNRKIVYRPNLAVLKGAGMTAALAEIGFITNAEERAKLLNEDYRQKAAAALCDSIIQSLSMITP